MSYWESLTSSTGVQHKLQNLPENLCFFLAKATVLQLVSNQGGLKSAQFYSRFPFQNLDMSKSNSAKSDAF